MGTGFKKKRAPGASDINEWLLSLFLKGEGAVTWTQREVYRESLLTIAAVFARRMELTQCDLPEMELGK